MKKIFIILFTMIICINLNAKSNDFNNYLIRTFIDEDGNTIDEILVPGKPPEFHREPAVDLPDPNSSESINILSDVPTFDWSFGCSATSAAMIAGYYDRTGYNNMYSGPTNGGVMPMDNTSWPDVVINGETRHQCPLSATHNGLDGRTTNGHVDDYWYQYGSNVDPYYGNWTEHTYGECTADYMGTNQYINSESSDGSTWFYYNTNGSPLYNYTGCEPGRIDGCHGFRDFLESRGYSIQVSGNYSQYIYGHDGNTNGFTYNQFKNEIDAGRPVMIHVVGHTMVGFGYDDSSNLVYIHDTWDHSNHTMTWGGSYNDMQHYGVGVFMLEPAIQLTADFTSDTTSGYAPLTVNFTDLSSGNPTSWEWDFQNDGTIDSYQQNPSYTYQETGFYTVSLTVTGVNGSTDTEVKGDYIEVTEPNNAPQLSNGGVNPDQGYTTDTYTYTVDYYDADGDTPDEIIVYIDGGNHTMSLSSGSYSNGTYEYQTSNLNPGSHTYYFYCEDGNGGDDRLPPSGSYNGPEVTEPNNAPQLSNGGVNPDQGYTTDTYTYTVDYYDADGDTPYEIIVYIDGNSHSMSLSTGSAANGTYQYNTNNLNQGSHTYYFYCEDGNGGDDRLPPSGSYNGPSVQNPEFPSPENLVAESDSNSFVPLSWNIPSQKNPSLDGYNIYRSLTSGSGYNTIHQINNPAITNYEDDNVTNGTNYYYVVTAIYSNPNGESVYSNEATAKPQGRYSISGSVIDDENNPIENVSIELSGFENNIEYTNSNGYYYFNNLIGGKYYLITPSKDGWTFDPSYIEFNSLDNNYYNQDFIGISDYIFYNITGDISYCIDGDPISNVVLEISGNNFDTVTTNINGHYIFSDLPEAGNYLITPHKEGDINDNCISALDAAWVLKNSIGIMDFTECQLQAGDVTGNGSISALDAAKILKYSIDLINEFPIGKEWCFIPENVYYQNLQQSLLYENYTGVAYGDVTYNWSPPTLVSKDGDTEKNGIISIANVQGIPGEVVNVPINLQYAENIHSAIIILTYDTTILTFKEVNLNSITEEFILEKNITTNEVRIALCGLYPIKQGGDILELSFQIKKDIHEDHVSSFSFKNVSLNEIQNPITIDGEIFVTVNPDYNSHSSDILQVKSYPNPMKHCCNIEFNLLNKVHVEINVFNIYGELIENLLNDELKSGTHIINWQTQNIPNGIYFYQIVSENKIITKKIILLN